jgi:hypothetical protein
MHQDSGKNWLLTSLDGTYTYGMSASSHRTGTWVMTSIGDMFPAITHTLHKQKQKNIKNLEFA